MKTTPELMSCIRAAIESVEYGSVEVIISEKGEFVELLIQEKIHIPKETVNVLFPQKR